MKTQIVKKGKWKGNRYCKSCNAYHAVLHICSSYPVSLKEEIKKQIIEYEKSKSKQLRKAARDLLSNKIDENQFIGIVIGLGLF